MIISGYGMLETYQRSTTGYRYSKITFVNVLDDDVCELNHFEIQISFPGKYLYFGQTSDVQVNDTVTLISPAVERRSEGVSVKLFHLSYFPILPHVWLNKVKLLHFTLVFTVCNQPRATSM